MTDSQPTISPDTTRRLVALTLAVAVTSMASLVLRRMIRPRQAVATNGEVLAPVNEPPDMPLPDSPQSEKSSIRYRLALFLGLAACALIGVGIYMLQPRFDGGLRGQAVMLMALGGLALLGAARVHGSVEAIYVIASPEKTSLRREQGISRVIAQRPQTAELSLTSEQRRRRWLIFISLLAGSVLGLYLLPVNVSSIMFLALVAGTVIAVGVSEQARIAAWWESVLDAMRRARQTALPLNLTYDRPLNLLQTGVEIAVVVAAALLVTEPFRITRHNLKLYGGEAEWLTSSVYLAHQNIREYGYIPLWQPYLEMGEPLIDNPFSFVLNPISAGPSLLVGGVQGIKYSVVLYAIFAGVGGWFLGRVLNLGIAGRLLMALLMIGKGNMQAMIGTGYFQLGVTQAYFPWIVGGTLAILRLPGRRWPVVLTAVMFTLLFWAGNIWYTLPMLMTVILLGGVHIFQNGRVDGAAFRRLALAGALTVSLSAVSLLPIWAHRGLIGGHPDEKDAGLAVDVGFVLNQFVDGSLTPYHERTAPGGPQFYYSYVSPLWYLALIFVVIPPIWPFLYQPSVAASDRIWKVGLAMIIFTFVWGVGGNPVFIWLYEHIPLLGQWRFVGRALAVTSFWVIVLMAMRVDGLWRVIVHTTWNWASPFIAYSLKLAAAALLVIGSSAAVYQVITRWSEVAPLDVVNVYDARCVDWLRDHYPDRQLAVYRLGYDAITTFLDNKVREATIEADYFPYAAEPTLGNYYLTDFYNSLPEFGLVWEDNSRAFLRDLGYHPIPGSPDFGGGPCLWRNPDTFYYAYTTPLATMMDPRNMLEPDETTPIYAIDRKPDQITLWVDAHPSHALVVAVQELNYPGWEVMVDGAPAQLESVGGQIGVVVPPGAQTYEIYFRYRPPLLYLGGALTLLAAAFCVVYLLRGERLLRSRKP